MPLIKTAGLPKAIKEELARDGNWLTTRNMCNRIAWLVPPEAIKRYWISRDNGKNVDSGSLDKAIVSIVATAMRDLTRSRHAERRKNAAGKYEYRVLVKEIKTTEPQTKGNKCSS